MYIFKGKCIDPSYNAECMFLKEIIGNAFCNNKYGEAKIKYNGDWYEVDIDTVQIIKDDYVSLDEE